MLRGQGGGGSCNILSQPAYPVANMASPYLGLGTLTGLPTPAAALGADPVHNAPHDCQHNCQHYCPHVHFCVFVTILTRYNSCGVELYIQN